MRVRVLVVSIAVAACSTAGTRQSSQGASGVDAGPFRPLTVDGGTLPDLVFAVVGDTRPYAENDNAGYPSAVIRGIYEDLATVSPAPLFVIATGDYQYVSPGSGNSAPQLGAYLQARAAYPGTLFPAMGNHECTGATASECGPDGADGETENYKTFLSMLDAPIGATAPYYAVPLRAADGSWTAKLVVIAANAWDSAQAAWLTAALATQTTYTLLVQHEPTTDVSDLAALADINAIVAAAPQPPTLYLVGHSHTFEGVEGVANEVVVGNGGVPYTQGDFGYALVVRQPGGDLQLTQYDWTSNLPTAGGISLTVTPAGQSK